MAEYRHLYELINNNFNYGELTLLCKSLDLDIEELPGGSSKKLKAMELQEYMRRRGRTYDLLREVHHERPHLDLRPFDGPGPEDEKVTPVEAPVPSIPTDPSIAEQATGPSAAAKDYENFDIHIGMSHVDGRYPLNVINSPAGQTTGTILQTLPLDDQAFSDVVYYLHELMATTLHAERLSSQLRDFLFPPPVWNLYVSSLAIVKERRKKGLRIRLHFSLDSSPELSQIPWEYCAGDKTYLALNETTPVIRYIQTDRPSAPIAIPETVRILVVMASPDDLPTLNVEEEEKRIRQALTPLEGRGQVEVQVAPHTTRRRLFKHFSIFDPHILHFVGHGQLDQNGEGVLILENEIGKSDPVNASRMHVLLQDSNVRLVILNACETAATSEGKALMGMAPRLVWAGIPAVIAMQFMIPDPIAVAFMEDLYDALAQGKPLDMAMTAARKGAYIVNDEIYWAIPVLFLHAPDGVIWRQS